MEKIKGKSQDLVEHPLFDVIRVLKTGREQLRVVDFLAGAQSANSIERGPLFLAPKVSPMVITYLSAN